MFSLFVVGVALVAAPTPTDTLTVATRTPAPIVDGRADAREYGAPSVRIVTPAGDVQVWVTRDAEFLYVAASLPDTSFYWGDDFVISLDADGSADASPQAGDRQWYLRRVLDSSEVSNASNGRWNSPGQPEPMLGTTRHHELWNLLSFR